MIFFMELEQTFQKFLWIYLILYSEKRQNCQSNPEGDKKKKTTTTRKHNSPRLQTILQSYSNQNIVVLVQKQTYKQWNRTENAEIHPDTYGQLIFDK